MHCCIWKTSEVNRGRFQSPCCIIAAERSTRDLITKSRIRKRFLWISASTAPLPRYSTMIKASANAGDVRSAEETAYRARGGISVEPSHRWHDSLTVGTVGPLGATGRNLEGVIDCAAIETRICLFIGYSECKYHFRSGATWSAGNHLCRLHRFHQQ